MNNRITKIVADYMDYIEFDVSDVDMSQVKDYGVKWGTLYIVMKDGTQITIVGSDSQGDYKWPVKTHLYDDEYNVIEEMQYPIIQGDGSSYMTAKDIEKEITELTQEGSAYWDKNHINHQKSVDEVLKLREMLNNG